MSFMFEIESDKCEDLSCDSHQDWPTQSMLASESPVRMIRAKIYMDSGKRGWKEICEQDATNQPPDLNMMYPLSPTDS